MKLNGIFGKGTGKLGSTVYAVSGGEQIVREYNPNVSNPSTDAQVKQRAKLKLMSQVAAALASIIAFKKKGLVSARNQFISANIGLCTYEDGQAELALDGLDLTGSKAVLPGIQVTSDDGVTIAANLSNAATADIDAVLYASVSETSDSRLEVKDVKIATTPGEGRTFAEELQSGSGNTSVYAYGIKYTDDASRIRFADYVAQLSQDSANLFVEYKEFMLGASFTQTKYAQL